MLLRCLVIGAAVAAWLVPLPASWVERVYSRGTFAWMQPGITAATNRVPFSLFDLLLVGGITLLVAALAQAVSDAWRKGRVSRVLRFAFTVVAVAGVAYLGFLAMWGLNYRREPLADRLARSAAPVDKAALIRFGHLVVGQLNQFHDRAHEDGFPAWDEVPADLEAGYRAVQARLAPGTSPRPGVPKWSILSSFFERAGVSGMTDPFFLEVLVDRDLLPFERPFVLAHEWSHLAGYADEAEANFVGWLTCVNSGPAAAYSGWLYVYSDTLASLPAADRVPLVRALAAGPRADLSAVAERARRIRPMLRSVSWRVYDRYLKANRVQEGIASYDRALLLVLRTQFGDRWMPIMK